MAKTPTPSWNTKVYEEACEWFVEFRTGAPGAARRQAFHAWLQQSPGHMGAYLEAAALWNQTATLIPGEKYSIEGLIASAAADFNNICPLEGVSTSTGVVAVRHAPRRVLATLAAAAALVAVGVVAVSVLRESRTYTTAIGEQRSIVLSDGSMIQLNSRSRVLIRYTDQRRQIQLLEGQALFTVAHDTARPFLVDAGGTAVRAVGTKFDVNRLSTETVVTVLEGKVAVVQDSSQVAELAGAVADVAAGEQLQVNRSGALHRANRPNIAAATAWTQRRLVFESAFLVDVVEEFNRYNPRPLRIQSVQLNGFQIDGVFSSADPQPLIRFLQTRPGIRVNETKSAIEISAADPEP